MNTKKRQRGRPVGTGKNDRVLLQDVADLLALKPSLRPTSAMRETLRRRRRPAELDDATIRRLQAKWQTGGNGYMKDATEFAQALESMPHIRKGIAWSCRWSQRVIHEAARKAAAREAARFLPMLHNHAKLQAQVVAVYRRQGLL